MFERAGKKIKSVAKGYFVTALIVSIVIGVVLLVIGLDFGNRDGETLMCVGVGMAIVGPIVAWLSALLMYGFGVLVEKAEMDLIRYAAPKRVRDHLGVSDKCETCGAVVAPDAKFCTGCGNAVSAASQRSVSVPGGWKCISCGRVNLRYQTTCSCGAKKPH